MPDDDKEPVSTAHPADSDGGVESDIHDFRELLRTNDQEGLVSALENPELYRMACDDERYMRTAMEGIAVLAWDDPARASEFLVHFDAAKSRENPASDARRAARSILAALEWRQLEAQNVLPVASMSTLRNFLRLFPALGERGEHGSELRKDLTERPAFYADFFQKLAKAAHVLPGWIFQIDRDRCQVENDPEKKDNVLEELDESQLSALSSAISELRASLKSRMSQYLIWIVVVGVVAAMPNAVGALVALVVIGAYMGLGENKSYEVVVRPRLVTLAIEHGVGATHVVSWIYRLSRKAGRVGSFDIKIENDLALDLLAALSRTANPSAEPAQQP
jgi:hypothetical protein